MRAAALFTRFTGAVKPYVGIRARVQVLCTALA
jgi:hypothetical protein